MSRNIEILNRFSKCLQGYAINWRNQTTGNKTSSLVLLFSSRLECDKYLNNDREKKTNQFSSSGGIF